MQNYPIGKELKLTGMVVQYFGGKTNQGSVLVALPLGATGFFSQDL